MNISTDTIINVNLSHDEKKLMRDTVGFPDAHGLSSDINDIEAELENPNPPKGAKKALKILTEVKEAVESTGLTSLEIKWIAM